MSSLIRRSTSLARVAGHSLTTYARSSSILRASTTPRLLGASSSAWADAVRRPRYYSTENGKPKRDPNDADKVNRKGADPAKPEDSPPQVKSSASPGPTKSEAPEATDDRLPLLEGWVYLTEEEYKHLEIVIDNSYFPLMTDKDKRELKIVRRIGVPKEVHELLQKRKTSSLGLSDIGTLLKGVNILAKRLASDKALQDLMDNETKAQKNGEPTSRPSKSYEESSSETRQGQEKKEDGKDRQDTRRHFEFGQNSQGSPKSPPPPPPSGPRIDWLTTIISTVVAYWVYSSLFEESGREITWQELRKNFLDKGLVEKLVVIGGQVRVELNREATNAMYPDSAATRPGFHYYFSIGSIDAFERRLDEAQQELGIPSNERIPVSYAGESGFMKLLLAFGPTVVLVGLLLWASRRGPGGGAGSGIFGMGKSKAKRFNHETSVKIKFSDVAGMDEAKQEIMEFVSFLSKPERFQRLGAKIPRGAILSGPPGTGKTMLAKATAGESGVPFFSVSGSEFVEMFVGVGASRVRDLFTTARKNAPCIIFIDEIDAIGKSRAEGKSFGGGHDEREATLNQILTEMDGFNTSEQVVVLAGTNRPDILDKALLRPGRFDRHVHIDKPTMAGRQDIFKVYLKKIVTNEETEYLSGRLAALTPGFAGADIANCVNEAALIAARGDAKTVTMTHFEQAIERVVGGLERKSLVLSPEEKKTVAYHEAGHAICGWYFRYADPLLKVSIIPRGQGALGYAQYLPGDAYLLNYNQLMDRMAMTLGGRISEEIHFPTVTTGGSDDFRKVTRMANLMVTEWGMSPKLGTLSFKKDENSLHKPFAEVTAETIDQEIRRIVDEAYKQCKDLLLARKKEIGIVAEELLTKEVLVRDDMIRLLGPRPFDDREEFTKYFGGSADPNKDKDHPPSNLPGSTDVPPAPMVFREVDGRDVR